MTHNLAVFTVALLFLNIPHRSHAEPLNKLAGNAIVYEAQVRSANACRNDTGSPEQRRRCAEKVAPAVSYLAESWASDKGCQNSELNYLETIKLGTLEDMMTDTTDYRVAISLKYIKERVKANTVWLMPIFPHNVKWNIPHRCDNIGSPYSVRDYMHVRPSLSQFCIKAGHTEFQDPEDQPMCFGNQSFTHFMEQANKLGLRVMLDLAFNHFGHNYNFYDYTRFRPIDALVGNDLDKLWTFDQTFDQNLVTPEILDSTDDLARLISGNTDARLTLEALKVKCPRLQGDEMVRAFNMFRVMQPWEKAKVECEGETKVYNDEVYLERWAPGFYSNFHASKPIAPSTEVGDNHQNNWSDVKFLYLHENHNRDERGDFYPTFVRNREYMFRIMNYWVSQGVQGFRLDHTSDGDSGIGANFWRYVIAKVNHYDWVRKGRPQSHERPIYLAEEFNHQGPMTGVVDVMIDGFVGDIRGGLVKGSAHVRQKLDADSRFQGKNYVARGLETHDEHRLYHDTGFDPWNGAGFWSAAAASRGMPLLVMGQEIGAHQQLAFRKSTFLASRFVGAGDDFFPQDKLLDLYAGWSAARSDYKNRALAGDNRFYLKSTSGTYDERIHAQVKWSDDRDQNVVFSFVNLWEKADLSQAYVIPQDIAGKFSLRDDLNYCLIDAVRGGRVGDRRSGYELRTNFYVKLGGGEDNRVQWLRLERCD